MKQIQKPVKEEVIKELPPVSKYRVRVLQNPKTQATVLDIREFVSSESFEGFTRRGIRITNRAEVDALRDHLGEVLDLLKA